MTIIGRPTIYLNGKVTLEWSLDSNNMITFNLVLSNGISHPAPLLGVAITADYSYVQAGIFDMGTCTFTSGANNGLSRTVASSLTGVLNFAMPLPHAPAPGTPSPFIQGVTVRWRRARANSTPWRITTRSPTFRNLNLSIRRASWL